MFGKLKELFSGKEGIEHEFKQLEYSQARSFFVENTQNKLAETYEEFCEEQKKIAGNIKELETMLKELGETSAEEERAKGSLSVKDTFVERALQAISDISNNNRTFEEIKMFLEDVDSTVKQINGITPKQAMHLKFFFGEQMGKITAMTKAIEEASKNLEERFKIGFMEKRAKVQEMFKEIDDLIEKRNQKEVEIEKIPDELKYIKKLKKNELQKKDKIDANEMVSAQEHLDAMIKEKTEVKKELAARLSTIDRMLRKYAHKDISARDYATDSMKQLLEDEERKIVDILRKAIDSYELGFEEKEKQAARIFIRNYSDTARKVSQLKELTDKIKKKRHYMNSVYKPRQAELDRIGSTVSDYEKRLEEKETEKAHLQMEVQMLEKKLKQKKRELGRLLGSVLDKEIVVR
jgi:chromosome segregation ATPase